MKTGASLRSWPLRIGLLLVAAAVGIAAALLSVRREGLPAAGPALPLTASELPALDAVAPFSLIDAAGAPLTLDHLKGKVWTANLFFASCTSICPPLTRNLAKLQADVGADVAFELLSVSVDPAHDTPAVLAQYAAQYQADTNRWHFATAALEVVQAWAVESLHLGAPDEPIDHSPYVVLVDRDAQIRGFYDGLDAEAMGRLAADIRRVAGGATGAAAP